MFLELITDTWSLPRRSNTTHTAPLVAAPPQLGGGALMLTRCTPCAAPQFAGAYSPSEGRLRSKRFEPESGNSRAGKTYEGALAEARPAAARPAAARPAAARPAAAMAGGGDGGGAKGGGAEGAWAAGLGAGGEGGGGEGAGVRTG